MSNWSGLPKCQSFRETKLLHELERVRQQGIALNLGENFSDMHGIATPIRDAHGAVIAALSIAGPSSRIDSSMRGPSGRPYCAGRCIGQQPAGLPCSCGSSELRGTDTSMVGQTVRGAPWKCGRLPLRRSLAVVLHFLSELIVAASQVLLNGGVVQNEDYCDRDHPTCHFT